MVTVATPAPGITSTGPRPHPVKERATQNSDAAHVANAFDRPNGCMSSTSRDFRNSAAATPEPESSLGLRLTLSLLSPLVLALAYPKTGFGWLALVALA